jgi:hypothetical protein
MGSSRFLTPKNCWRGILSKPRGKGKPFKKGNKLAVGRPKMTEEQKKLARMTRTEVMDVMSQIVRFNKKELMALKNDPKTSLLKAWVGSVAAKGIKLGDMDRLDKLLNRVIGKVKEEVEFQGNAVNVLVKLPGNGSEKKKI